MEFNFSIYRIALLSGFIAAFYLLGGFTPLSADPESMLNPARLAKAKFYCMILFLAGAVCTSIIDHFVGTFERSNLRLLYMIVGVILMVGSFLYIRSLKELTTPANHRAEQAEIGAAEYKL